MLSGDADDEQRDNGPLLAVATLSRPTLCIGHAPSLTTPRGADVGPTLPFWPQMQPPQVTNALVRGRCVSLPFRRERFGPPSESVRLPLSGQQKVRERGVEAPGSSLTMALWQGLMAQVRHLATLVVGNAWGVRGGAAEARAPLATPIRLAQEIELAAGLRNSASSDLDP